MFIPPLEERPPRGRDALPLVVKRPMIPHLANLVFTSTVNVMLDLNRLVRTMPWLEYNPVTFASAIGRYDAPHLTCLISPSGKIVVTGARNEYAALFALVRFLGMIFGRYPQAHVSDLRLQNFTCTANLGVRLDITRCARENPHRCVYGAAIFPGMHVKPDVGRCRHIVFHSGQIVVTGARSDEQAVSRERRGHANPARSWRA